MVSSKCAPSPSISCCWSASSSFGSPFWTGVIKTACPALPSGSVGFSRFFFSRLCFAYCRSFSLTSGDSLCLLSRCFSALSRSLCKSSFRRHSSIVAKTLLNKYLVKRGYVINMKWTLINYYSSYPNFNGAGSHRFQSVRRQNLE